MRVELEASLNYKTERQRKRKGGCPWDQGADLTLLHWLLSQVSVFQKSEALNADATPNTIFQSMAILLPQPPEYSCVLPHPAKTWRLGFFLQCCTQDFFPMVQNQLQSACCVFLPMHTLCPPSGGGRYCPHQALMSAEVWILSAQKYRCLTSINPQTHVPGKSCTAHRGCAHQNILGTCTELSLGH